MFTTKQKKENYDLRSKQILSMGFEPLEGRGDLLKGKMIVTVEAMHTWDAEKWDVLISEIETAFKEVESDQGTSLIKFEEVTAVTTATFDKAKLIKVIESEKVSALALIATSLNDKEVIKKIRKGKSDWRKVRTTLEGVRENMKSDIIKKGREIDTAFKEIQAEVSVGESHFDKEISKIEAWENAEKLRIENEAQAEINRRIAVLKESGIVFDGSFYSIGESLSVDIVTLKALTDIQFQAFNDRVIAEKARLDAIEEEKAKEATRIEEEKKVEAERVRLANIENERMAKELVDAAAAMVAEKEKMFVAKMKLRQKQLTSIGVYFNALKDIFFFENEFLTYNLTLAEFKIISDDEFDSLIENLEPQITAAKISQAKKENEEKELTERFNFRCNLLRNLGMSQYPSQYGFSLPEITQTITVSIAEIKDLDQDLWNAKCDYLKDAIQQIKDAHAKLLADRAEAEHVAAQQFSERSHQLFGIGLKIKGEMFVTPDDKHSDIPSVIITIGAVKAALPGKEWNGLFSDLDKKCGERFALINAKLAKIEAKKEARKPDIEKAQKHIDNCWDSIKNTSSSIFKDENVSRIYSEFYRNIYDAVNKFSHLLIESKNTN